MSEISQKGGFGSTNTQIVIQDSIVDVVRSPSIFMQLVSILSSTPRKDVLSDNYQSYDIERKIDFNDIIKHREKIEYYYTYVSMIETAYSTLNESRASARETSLEYINSKYKDCVGEILLRNKGLVKGKKKEEVEEIRRIIIKENSDEIIDCVIEHINKTCEKSLTSINCTIEEIAIHSELIVFHAFVECKVLEKPL